MELSQILDNLFVGSCPVTKDDARSLKGLGVTGLVNLQSDADFDFHGIDWPILRAAYFTSDIVARRVPITDFDDDDLRERLPEAVRTLSELIEGDHTVLLHCNVGVNRSPSAAICYLHWRMGWALEDAERYVKSCRQCSPVMDVVRLATRDWGR